MDTIDSILAGKYPAKAHAEKVVDYIRRKKNASLSGGVIYLEGQKTRMLEDNDEAEPFRQRRNFYYLSGVDVPDCYLAYEIDTKKLTLFIPPIDPDDVIWSGLPLMPEEALKKYDIDEVQTIDQVNQYLSHVGSKRSPKSAIFAVQQQVSDHITFLSFDEKDFVLLKEACEESRVVKDEYEIALTRKANLISGIAHTEVLKHVKHKKNEQELMAVFIERCIANGARKQSYGCIVASGENAATLHYQRNDEELSKRWNLLLDAGGEYRCYTSDITRTFPLHGKFNKESRQIYDIVLKMQLDCIAMLKEGVCWDDVHAHAHKIAIDGLLNIGIFKGSAEEIFKARTSVAFFPHGLGHYLGMDTHDTGGHANYADKDTMFRYLRVRGTLPAGSIITVEPGIYFCRFIIDPYLKNPDHAKYINEDVLNEYWDVGGVRIEDNLLITKSGSENLTNAIKDVAEMEKIINS
ncbi:putative Xaa-Pro aminopeptidase pepP [Xylona heveae TC161]|uniref:Xaa-Pro aminopeptidase n=1 Tax=Xylona heveae (strain CBS 132557 / TC161) TaxID=1328760 RepID=A0A165FYR5_XYLHT|nr:putative Xaa-Pro aminopeptidase pepP [Xylona heveae TC161]KZF21541.1 putative Xaa-Pro aminopeptidase pepP [Xylona heveae TC161]